MLTASGCPSGWFYAWQIPVHDPVTNAVTVQRWVGNPQTVKGPETYKVQCVLQGNPDGPFESINITPLSIYDININITPNKTEANQGETVIFTATGNCPNGAGIRWFINGMNYWTWVGQTFQATGPGTYSARCESGYQQSKTVDFTIKTPKPGAVSIIADKPRVRDNEIVTLRAVGCDNEVNWTLPNGTEVPGSAILFNFGPGVYKAKCLNRFGFTSDPSSISIALRNADEPAIVGTNTSININELAELSITNCPNNWVGWKIPVKDANGNITYQYTSNKTQVIHEPGIYYYHCAIGNYTEYIPLEIHPAPTNALVIKASKTVAKPDEQVVLTAYGCPNGKVEWANVSQTASGTRITVVGPGLRKAKCVGDISNNGDWAMAYTKNDGEITPYLTASVTEACPSEPVTITAYGCPNGWWYQTQWVKPGQLDYWLTHRQQVDDFGEGYFDVFGFGGGTINTNGPNIYYARCISPDGGWMGDFRDKSVIINPAFPADLRVSNNGPALTGAASVSLAVTEVPNASYAWRGPNAFVSAARSPIIPNPTEAKSGIYTVTLKRGTTESWACSTTATTKLTVSGCDIRIKASDPNTGVESYVLPYTASPTRDFGDLGLEVISPSGMPLSNMSFLWTKPDGTTSTDQQLVVDKKGIYNVRVNVTGTTIGCRATASITEAGTRYMLWTKARDLTMLGGTVPVKAIPLKYEEKTDRTFFYGEGGLPASDEFVTGESFKTKSYVVIYTISTIVHTEVLKVIPDYNYAKTHPVWNQNDFNGRMMMYDYKEKTFLGGWKYSNGIPIKRLYEYETTGETPIGDDCKEVFHIDHASTATLDENLKNYWISKGYEIIKTYWNGDFDIRKKCGTGTTPNTSATSSGGSTPTPDYGITGWIFNSSPYVNTIPVVVLPPEIINGGGTVVQSSSLFKEQMGKYIANFFTEATNVEQKININNNDAVSEQRFALYVKLLIDAMKTALLQSDDITVRGYANKIGTPSTTAIHNAYLAYTDNGSGYDPFHNPFVAALNISNEFQYDIPIDVFREEKIDALFKDISVKVKNAYNALVPLINDCSNIPAGARINACNGDVLISAILNILKTQGKELSEIINPFYDGSTIINKTNANDFWNILITDLSSTTTYNSTTKTITANDGSFQIVFTPVENTNQNAIIALKTCNGGICSTKNIFVTPNSEINEAVIAPLVAQVIKAGGEALAAFVFDLALQYVFEGTFMIVEGKATGITDTDKIWPKVSMLSAGGVALETLAESFFSLKSKTVGAAIGGAVSMAENIKQQYDALEVKYGENTSQILKEIKIKDVIASGAVGVVSAYLAKATAERVAAYAGKFVNFLRTKGASYIDYALEKANISPSIRKPIILLGLEQKTGRNASEITNEIKDNLTVEATEELMDSQTLFNLAKTQPTKFKLGIDFENRIKALFNSSDATFVNTVQTKLGLSLSGYTTKVSQLQVRLPNGNYMVMDNAWLKPNTLGGFDVIYNECKLSSSSPWTEGQQYLLGNVSIGYNTFDVRSIKFDELLGIKQNAKLTIKGVVETIGDGTVNGTYIVNKLYP